MILRSETCESNGTLPSVRVDDDGVAHCLGWRMAIEYTSPSGALYWLGDGEGHPLDIFTDELHDLAYLRRVFSRSKHLSTLARALPAMVRALGGER